MYARTPRSFSLMSMVDSPNLTEGARISYEVVMKRGGKMSAENLRLS